MDPKTLADKLMETWPARLAQDAWSAVKAPGNALASTPENPVTTEQMVKPAADLAGIMVGTPGGSGGLGSHLRGMPTSELSFSERMALGKELAMERSNRGFSTGSQGRSYSVSPDAPRGSFDRLYQEQRSYWNQDKDAALNAYREAIDPSHGAMLAPGETLDDMAREFTLGSGATDKRTAAIAQGIRAYHGSPHDFDRFDLSKIGTGEGAQAYGHGLYFAENPKVAMDYRNKLSEVTAPGFYQFGGKEFIGRTGPEAHALSLAYHDTPQTARRIATEGLAAANAGEPWALEMGGVPYWQQMKAQADMIRSKRDIGFSQGRMYEVNINAHPDQFLDWDKPLYRQSDPVREALSGLKIPVEPTAKWTVEPAKTGDKFVLRNVWGEPSGVYKDRSKAEAIAAENTDRHHTGGAALTYQQLGGNQVYNALDKGEASRKLLDAGIPGIKYLDQGSRTAGDGSRNYVVFDDKLIDIMKKYGIAGLGVPGLAAGVPISNQEQ